MSLTEQYHTLKTQLEESSESLSLWTSLLATVEESFQQNQQLAKEDKTTIYGTFDEFLSKWPLLFGYWKKYTSITYQLDGLEQSLLVLKRSLEVFPHCLELWVDYLVILMGQTDNEGDLKLEDQQVVNQEFIRSEFERAIGFVGGVFMSHEVWDKYVSWEQTISKKNQSDNERVVEVLWKAIHVPLYQYSRIYTTFTEEWQKLASVDKIQKITGLNRSELSEFKLEFDLVFQKTQQYVSEIWQFESVIKQKFFNNEINKEDLPIWVNYLEFQIQKYTNDKTSMLIKTQVISTFEQCLIPMANNEKIWYKYLSFLLFTVPDLDHPLINSIYSRACNFYLPLDHYEIRLNWALFIESYSSDALDLEKIEEIYLATIAKNPLEYKPIIQYIKFLSRRDTVKTTITSLQQVIDVYLKRSQISLSINQERLLKVINDKTIGMLITEIIKLTNVIIHNAEQTKKLIIEYSESNQLQSSLPYLTQSYNFFKKQGDLSDLKWIMKLVFDSGIPLSYKKLIIEDYTEFLESNQEMYQSINQFYPFDHPENGPPYNLLSFDKLMDLYEENVQKSKKIRPQYKNVLYPGFQIMEPPSITNVDIDQVASQTVISELPTFKGVEKASKKVEPLENI